MWPFKNKYPPREGIRLAENKWTVAAGNIDSRPAIVGFNADAKRLCGHPDYRYQVGIAVPLKHPDTNGFPSRQESAELGVIEDAIVKEFQIGNESLLVGRLTTDGMREFVLYTVNPDGVKAKFDKLQQTVTSHEVQLMIQEDPKWSVYKTFFTTSK